MYQETTYRAAQAVAELAADHFAQHIAAARLRLDIEQLPNLLQVNALTSKDWDLSSDWYRWVIRPAEIKAGQRADAP